jgi:hypothetical protein
MLGPSLNDMRFTDQMLVFMLVPSLYHSANLDRAGGEEDGAVYT